MKKLFWKLQTIILALIMVMILLALVSCKSSSMVQCGGATVQDSSELFSIVHSVDTIILRDSIYIQEITKGDTIYLTRTEYRDRWRTRLVHDTIRDTQYIERVIEHPPERYIPKFYRWCTGVLIALLVLAIGRLGYKAMRRYIL